MSGFASSLVSVDDTDTDTADGSSAKKTTEDASDRLQHQQPNTRASSIAQSTSRPNESTGGYNTSSNRSVHEQLEEAEAVAEAAVNETAKLRKEKAKLSKQVSSLQSQLEHFKSRADAPVVISLSVNASNANATAQSATAAASSSEKELFAQIEELQKRARDAEAKLEAGEVAGKAEERALNQAEQEKSALAEQLEEEREQMRRETEAREQAEEGKDAAERKLREIERELEEKRSKASQVQQEAKRKERKALEETEAERRQKEEAKEREQSMREELERARNERENFANEIAELQKRNSELVAQATAQPRAVLADASVGPDDVMADPFAQPAADFKAHELSEGSAATECQGKPSEQQLDEVSEMLRRMLPHAYNAQASLIARSSHAKSNGFPRDQQRDAMASAEHNASSDNPNEQALSNESAVRCAEQLQDALVQLEDEAKSASERVRSQEDKLQRLQTELVEARDAAASATERASQERAAAQAARSSTKASEDGYASVPVDQQEQQQSHRSRLADVLGHDMHASASTDVNQSAGQGSAGVPENKAIMSRRERANALVYTLVQGCVGPRKR